MFFLFLSKEQSSMEGMSDSSLQTSSNQFLADVDLRLPSPCAVGLKERKSKETSPKPVYSQEKYAFPLRPLRRKDSLASHCKELSDGSVQCSTVNFPDGLFKSSPAAQISNQGVQPQLENDFSKMPVMTTPSKLLQQRGYTTQTTSPVAKVSESLQADPSFSSMSPDLSSEVLGDLKPKVCHLRSVNKPPDWEDISSYQSVHVDLTKKKPETGTQSHVEDFPGERSSILQIPKPRTKKQPRGLFMDDDLNHDLPAACLPSDKESGQQDEPLILPVPLPRTKKRLGASYSGSTQNENRSLIQQNEVSLKNTAAILISKETIQGEGHWSSQVEREVLAAMAEEDFTYADSQVEARDDLMEGWTLTDQCGVIDHFEQDAEMVLDTNIAGDGWLCIASDKDVKLQSESQVKFEEVDFGFVSIDVAADSVDGER